MEAEAEAELVELALQAQAQVEVQVEPVWQALLLVLPCFVEAEEVAELAKTACPVELLRQVAAQVRWVPMVRLRSQVQQTPVVEVVAAGLE
jgi:hypothetical protein